MLLHDEWIACRAELPPQHQVLADLILARAEAVMTGYHNRQLEEVQRVERRMEVLRGLLDELRSAVAVLEATLEHDTDATERHPPD